MRTMVVALFLFVASVGGTAARGQFVSAISSANDPAVCDAVNRFGFDLYKHLRRHKGNLVFSPISISTALAMTYAGAEGRTEKEMAGVLHFDTMRENRVHRGFGVLVRVLNDGSTQDGYRLVVANRLFGQRGYGFLPAFLNVNREQYGAELAELDFRGGTDAARRRINAWVGAKTERKIEELIPPGALDAALTRLVLANAVYFHGEFTYPFEEQATADTPFHISANRVVNVPMMYQQRDFLRYVAVDGVKVLELPYGTDRRISMLILLPNEAGGLHELEQKLTVENMAKWCSLLRSGPVRVYLPRFELTSEVVLNDVLKTMGARSVFAPGEADLSGMCDQEHIWLSAFIHKAIVDTDEKGTEAAAASAAIVAARAPDPEPAVFRADHPFVFLIRENRTNSLLFLGRVSTPQRPQFRPW